MLEIAKTSVLVLAVMVLVGGIMGFVKAKSKASIISGVISSILLGGSYAIALSNLTTGLSCALGICLLLSLVFVMRFIKTRKMMPAGMMLLLCIGTAGLLAKALFAPN